MLACLLYDYLNIKGIPNFSKEKVMTEFSTYCG